MRFNEFTAYLNTIVESPKDNQEYIYRGEPQKYKEVSSSLYRELTQGVPEQETFNVAFLHEFQQKIVEESLKREPVEAQRIGLKIVYSEDQLVQDPITNEIRKYGDLKGALSYHLTEESEIIQLCKIQHYGGLTNLIDFSYDYLIALFFACNKAPEENGRIIIVDKCYTENLKRPVETIRETADGIESIERIWDEYRYINPAHPLNRVIAQKSILVEPLDGYVKQEHFKEKIIKKEEKRKILNALNIYHKISDITIYNDIHGYINSIKNI